MSVIGYPSVPNLIIAWVSSLTDLPVTIPAHSVSTDLPSDYATHLPFVRVTRVGGARSLGKDLARVRIETFAAVYDDAETLANELDSRIEFDAVQFTNGEGRIYAASTNVPPAWTAWTDQEVTRFMGTYVVSVQSLLLH